MDIKSLLEEDGFTCKYIAETYGSAYSSPCPWCGGTDNSSVFLHYRNYRDTYIAFNLNSLKTNRTIGQLRYF